MTAAASYAWFAQVICANYFHLKARNAQMQEINSGRPAPIRFAVYSIFRRSA